MSATSRTQMPGFVKLIAICIPLILSQIVIADSREEASERVWLRWSGNTMQAMRAWSDLAEAGDPEAQHNIGYMYEEAGRDAAVRCCDGMVSPCRRVGLAEADTTLA